MQLNTVKITQMCYCGTVGVCLDVNVCVCVLVSLQNLEVCTYVSVSL